MALEEPERNFALSRLLALDVDRVRRGVHDPRWTSIVNRDRNVLEALTKPVRYTAFLRMILKVKSAPDLVRRGLSYRGDAQDVDHCLGGLQSQSQLIMYRGENVGNGY